jgi:hypothetical protein
MSPPSNIIGQRGLLVRVGIDSSCGDWNAPVNAQTGAFAYVPIPEAREQHGGLETGYKGFVAGIKGLGASLPSQLIEAPAHLDPDFRHLTYGDQGQRARRISAVASEAQEAFLVFYASLRDVRSATLIYAIIGFYWVAEVLRASDVPKRRWNENAHTRRTHCAEDVVVRAVPQKSGRLTRCLPIGSYRDRAYRITPSLLKAWGGLDVRDGYVHRSAFLPEFQDPGRFLRWFTSQHPQLTAENF